MEQKYNVYDIRTTPHILVVETVDFTEEQCIEWITLNGDAVAYTISEQ
jgi:hypothetical protein